MSEPIDPASAFLSLSRLNFGSVIRTRGGNFSELSAK